MKTDGKEVVVEQGGVVQAPMEDIGKSIKKMVKAGPTGSTSLPGVAAHPKPVGGGDGSMVMASVLPSSRSQVMAAAKSGKGVLQVIAPPQPCKRVLHALNAYRTNYKQLTYTVMILVHFQLLLVLTYTQVGTLA